LEETAKLLLREYGIDVIRTENPGVWVNEDEKIAAVGVHLRRNITSHGIAINVDTDLALFDRIIACGLDGRRMTSMERILAPNLVPSIEELASKFVGIFAGKLGIPYQERA
jgi:lipoyl(octanoyl) transferase 2